MPILVERCERRRLQLRLVLFFVALAVPSALLLWKALDQLKWEAMRQSRVAAEALVRRIDNRLGELIREQDARPFTDFSFLTVAGDPQAGFLQRSPLSVFPVEPLLPGLIGWFQVDAAGRLNTPLLPEQRVQVADYGLRGEELAPRQALEQRIAAILGQNAVVLRQRADQPLQAVSEERAGPAREAFAERAPVPATPAPQAAKTQAFFDRLSAGRSDGLAALESPRQRAQADSAAQERAAIGSDDARAVSDLEALTARRARKEQAALPEPAEMGFAAPPKTVDQEESVPEGLAAGPGPADPADASAGARGDAPDELLAPAELSAPGSGRRIRIFESELAPFRFAQLDSGHLLLFRWAWRDGARYVQGALIERERFLAELIGEPFRASVLGGAVNLAVLLGERSVVGYGAASGRYEAIGSASVPAGTPLYRGRLQEPFGTLRLVFRVERLPSPPGASFVYWLGAILALVLGIGVLSLYRLGLRHLGLVRQQQDFVAAVSHELRTPLTSIRLYSEMLREGWVSDAKRDGYYRFIHDESERLSRLVANVLQLARLNREPLQVAAGPIAVAELLDSGAAPLASQAEQGGFELIIDCSSQAQVRADPDAVTQILINLVDNAIKFAAKAERRRIEVGCGPPRRGRLALWVRDYGPGIPKAERKRVFGLFQRLEREATRETQGTGIGLALVERLAKAMGAEVELIAREPGVEVRLWLAST